MTSNEIDPHQRPALTEAPSLPDDAPDGSTDAAQDGAAAQSLPSQAQTDDAMDTAQDDADPVMAQEASEAGTDDTPDAEAAPSDEATTEKGAAPSGSPDDDDALPENLTFDDLGLSEGVLRAVREAGYEKPTPIQAKAVPVALQGRDILGLAQTGTGKTASFTLPMIDLLSRGRGRARMPRSLILAPTRELAVQVAENFDKYGKYHRLTMALLIGGVSYTEQEQKLDRGVDVLIATPGRLLDHFERGRILLSGVQILVIDEADRMLDMGFIPDIDRIVKLTPFTRQTLFFSATMPDEIDELTRKFLQNPVRVAVSAPSSTAETVTQSVCIVQPDDKRETLRRLIRARDVKNAIIFCNRKRDVTVIFRSLTKHEFSVAALHGDLDQHVRLQVLDQFRKGNIQLLVASDVAARGLDIPDVSHVFNFDVPFNSEDYVHRIGRTGRAGRSGEAVLIATPSDQKYLDSIQKLIGRTIDVMEVEGIEAPGPNAASEDDAGNRRRRRGGRGRNRSEGSEARESNSRQSTSDDSQSEARSEAPRRREDRPSAAESNGRDARRTDERGGRRNRRGGRRRDYDGDDPPVVGMGDHVPAFMLRPIRTRRSTTSETEPEASTAPEDEAETITVDPMTVEPPLTDETTDRHEDDANRDDANRDNAQPGPI